MATAGTIPARPFLDATIKYTDAHTATSKLQQYIKLEEVLLTPENPKREWQSKVSNCFHDIDSFNHILKHLEELDADLTHFLEDQPIKSTLAQPPSFLEEYQDSVDAFISLFAQSWFILISRFTSKLRYHDVVDSLLRHKCPQMGLFRRLVANPVRIGTDDPDSLERLTTETGSYPTSQLAKICDVAVLRFLSSVTVKTEPRAIVWALDYLTEMIQHLDMSLRAQSEAGWCGVQFRKRKDTIRRSVIEPPKLAVDGTPIVVGILTPMGPNEVPSLSVNPETGQPAHPIVPTITIHEDTGGGGAGAVNKPKTRRSSRDESSVSQAAAALALVHKQPPSLVTSTEQDSSVGGPRRRHSVTAARPPVIMQLPTSSVVELPKRRSSTGSRPPGLSVPPPPVRKSASNISSLNPLASFATITEEESVDSTLPRQEKSTRKAENLPKLFSPADEAVGRSPLFSSLDFFNSPSSSPTVSPLPSFPSSPTSFTVHSPSPTSPSAITTSPHHRPAIPRTRSPSPGLSSLLESRKSPPKEEVPSDLESSSSDSEPEVKQKESALQMLQSPMPSKAPFSKLTPEILTAELQSFVTYEGRISLLGILSSISSLPTELKLWTDDNWDSCRKCFSLIQFCMDFGLETPKASKDNDSINHRRLYQQYNSQVTTNLDFEKPSRTYTRLVLQNALNALIQCAVSMYNGCSSDSCQLGQYTLQGSSRGASQNLHKMIHQLERLYSNSSFHFREAVMSFAQTSPCKKVFHFLHVILQYCPKGVHNDPLDPNSCRRDPLISLTAVVMRIVVDRLARFDLSEPTIQNGIVQEAVSFFRYAIALFNQDFLRVKAFQHLHHYVQRVALSVLLPIRAPPQSPPPTPPTIVESVVDMGTFPRKKEKRDLMELGFRKRGQTVHGDPNQVPSNQGKSPRLKRAQLVKQTSVHKDPQSSITLESSVTTRNTAHEAAMALLQEEWRGLKVGVLRARAQRLHLLLDFSEPGKMLEPGVLASLIAVGPVGSVVPRALVLLECALFVKKLGEGHKTHWLQDQFNQDDFSRQDLLFTLRNWAEAIGESIKNAELTEKPLLLQATSAKFSLEESSAAEPDSSQGPLFPDQVMEEPVLPPVDEERDPEKKYIVSYAIKMAACMLLLEITKFIREPPQDFLPLLNPPAHPIIQVSSAATPTANTDRKFSNLSILSTDSDSSRLAVSPVPPFAPPIRRLSSEQQIRSSTSPLLEELPKFHSVDQQQASPSALEQPPSHQFRKLSVYLRVNSRHGRQSRAPHPSLLPRTPEATSDMHRLASPNQSPVKSSRRMSMSVTALKQASVGAHDMTSGSARRLPRRSVAITAQPSFRRRMSVAGNLSVHDHARKEMSPNPTLHPHAYPRQGSVPGSGKGIGSPGNRKHRPSMLFNKVARKFAFRQRGKADQADKKKLSTTTQASSTGSNTNSPSLSHRRTLKHHSTSHTETINDIQTNLPWLDVVEHLAAAANSPSPAINVQRRKACLELVAALEKIYAGGAEAQFGSGKESSSTGSPVKGMASLRRNSISTAFSDNVFPGSETRPLVSSSLTRSATGSFQRPVDFHRALASLNFSGVQLTTFLVPTNDNMDLTVDELLEQDSAQDTQKIQQEHNRERLHYIQHEYAGLLHTPFSLLTYAAPLLHPPDFMELKEVAWEMLLDTDRELADAAASFFLLACAKVKDSKEMESFFSGKDRRGDYEAVKNVIARFKVLWKNRDLVWSRMEECAQTVFATAEEESDNIGYSLPSQPLGSHGQTLPFAPWQPSSVCTMLGCKGTSLKCYHGTRLAPSCHLHDITEMVRDFHVSAVNIVQETGQDSGGTNFLAIIDEQGNFSIAERLKSTVFPNSLLPLISIVIRSLSPNPATCFTTMTDAPEASVMNGSCVLRVSDAAEQVLWACMVDNPQHLFAPLLDQFNTIYRLTKEMKKTKKTEPEQLLGGVLKPLHTLLTHFPTLPPRAAQFLFNNFVGIVMRYTEQPVSLSGSVIQSVLGLLKMVVPSVQGLSMRKIKDELKKQSCYTTVLTTARIRGAEKIKVIMSDQENTETTEEHEIEDPDMSFGMLMSKASGIDDFFKVIHEYCFKDVKTNLPVLSSLIIQEHYTAATDDSLPTFSLQKPSSEKENWLEQLQMLFTHKMTEIARVLFSCEMLCCTQDKAALMENKFSQPNHHFIYNELLGNSSFPRRALYSLPYELGAGVLQRWELRTVDIMLRGVWTKFVLQLFHQLEGSYQVTENILVFITLLTGSLLLHCEDHVTLRNSLAALLTAAFKFASIFKTNGYQMVVPSLVQVYAIHSRNKLVKEAIKFIWVHFYWLNQNVFLLQAVASIANLLSTEADSLANLLGINYSPLNTGGSDEEKQRLVQSTMELIEALECSNYRSLPKDSLDILGFCPEKIYKRFHGEGHEPWQPCKLESVLSLCVVVASHGPMVLRGMQVLVFLDSMMPLVIKRFDDPEKTQTLMAITKSLVKGCDSIKKHQGVKGSHTRARRGEAGGDMDAFPTMYVQENQRLAALVRRLAFMRRHGTSQELSVSRNQSVAELPPVEQWNKMADGFRSRRQYDVNQKILTQAQQSVLSIASVVVSHIAKVTQHNGRRPLLDVASLQILSSVANQFLRYGAKTYCEEMFLYEKLGHFMTNLLPNVEWTAENASSFASIFERVVKIFKKMQGDTNKLMTNPDVWQWLTCSIHSITLCLSRYPSILIANNEPKIKNLLDILLAVKQPTAPSAGQGGGVKAKLPSTQQLIHLANFNFTEAVVELLAELISITQTLQSIKKLRIHIATLFSGKLNFKDHESEFVWRRLFLPLIIKMGLRDVEPQRKISVEDVDFLMQTIHLVAEHIGVIIMYRSTSHNQQISRFFTVLRVLLSALRECFSLEHWLLISQEILALASKFDASATVRNTASTVVNNEMYVGFCLVFLKFVEDFLFISRVPLFTTVWPGIFIIERRLKSSQHSFIVHSNPNLSSLVNRSLRKCSLLKSRSTLIPPVLSKQELLYRFSLDYLPLAERERVVPRQKSSTASLSTLTSSTSVPLSSFSSASFPTPLEQQPQQVQTHPPPTRRRSSYSRPPNFPAIQEKEEIEEGSPVTATDGNEEDSFKHHSRPTTLNLIPKSHPQSLEKYKAIAIKNKSGITVSSRTVSSGVRRSFPEKPVVKKVASPSRGPSAKKKHARGGSNLRQFNESSFDADDEDATHSPLHSRYLMNTWPTRQTDSDHSPPLNAKGGQAEMTTVPEVLEMQAIAEVHHQPRLLSLKESHSQETLTSPADTSHTTSQATLAAATSPASLNTSSTPKRRRPKLQRSDVVDTDEVTGQQREDAPSTNAFPELQTTATLPLETAKRLYKSCLKESSLFVTPDHSDNESDDCGDDV